MIRIQNEYYNDFKDRLYKTTKEKSEFNMEEITSFEWDKMYIILPYTSKPEMEEKVGIQWTTSKTYFGYLYEKTILGKHPLDDDGIHKLVLTKEEKVVLDITLNRMEIDFTQVQEVILFNDSQFIIKKEGNRCIILKNS